MLLTLITWSSSLFLLILVIFSLPLLHLFCSLSPNYFILHNSPPLPPLLIILFLLPLPPFLVILSLLPPPPPPLILFLIPPLLILFLIPPLLIILFLIPPLLTFIVILSLLHPPPPSPPLVILFLLPPVLIFLPLLFTTCLLLHFSLLHLFIYHDLSPISPLFRFNWIG